MRHVGCKCALKGGSHRNHDYKEIAEAFKVYKKDTLSTMAPMEKQLTTIDKAVIKFEKLRSAIVARQVSTKSKVNDAAAVLHQKIDARKEQLTTQVDQITEQKLKKLQTQMHQVKAIQSKYSASLDSMKKSVVSTNCREVLKMKGATIKEAKEVASSFQPTALKPTVESDVSFSADTDIDICASYGQIVKCSVVGDVPSKATVGQCSTVTLRASGFNGGSCEDLAKLITCVFLSDGSIKGEVSVQNYGGGQYVVNYVLSAEGNYQLHITVGGHHVEGSPFKITVSKPESPMRLVYYPLEQRTYNYYY